MPIYEYECEECGARFEELSAAGAPLPVCPECGGRKVGRVFSAVSPPARQPRGARVRSAEGRRTEREAARADRIAESRKRRAAGEKP